MGRLELVMESDFLSVYSPRYDGESITEFEKFLSLRQSFEKAGVKNDFDSIVSVIAKMYNECGAREYLCLRPGGGTGLSVRCVFIVCGCPKES